MELPLLTALPPPPPPFLPMCRPVTAERGRSFRGELDKAGLKVKSLSWNEQIYFYTDLVLKWVCVFAVWNVWYNIVPKKVYFLLNCTDA